LSVKKREQGDLFQRTKGLKINRHGLGDTRLREEGQLARSKGGGVGEDKASQVFR